MVWLLLLLSISISAQQLKTLTLYSSDGPPHMFEANQSGIDIDIACTILKEMGYQVSIKFSPLKRGMEQVKKHKADLFLPTFFQQDTDDIYISAPFIQYRPMIFTHRDSNLSIKSISDLYGLKAVSFQGAQQYFGEEFKQATQHNMYFELHDMSKFPEMLLMKRYDVVILDYYIFYYFLKMYQEQSSDTRFSSVDNFATLINQHDVINKVNAYIGFNNPNLRDKFNSQLQQFILNNRQQQIIEKYIGTINSRFSIPSTNIEPNS